MSNQKTSKSEVTETKNHTPSAPGHQDAAVAEAVRQIGEHVVLPNGLGIRTN